MQQTFTQHLHQVTGMKSIVIPINNAHVSTLQAPQVIVLSSRTNVNPSDDVMMVSGDNDFNTAEVCTRQMMAHGDVVSGFGEPVSRCPNIDAIKHHLECFFKY